MISVVVLALYHFATRQANTFNLYGAFLHSQLIKKFSCLMSVTYGAIYIEAIDLITIDGIFYRDAVGTA